MNKNIIFHLTHDYKVNIKPINNKSYSDLRKINMNINTPTSSIKSKLIRISTDHANLIPLRIPEIIPRLYTALHHYNPVSVEENNITGKDIIKFSFLMDIKKLQISSNYIWYMIPTRQLSITTLLYQLVPYNNPKEEHIIYNPDPLYCSEMDISYITQLFFQYMLDQLDQCHKDKYFHPKPYIKYISMYNSIFGYDGNHYFTRYLENNENYREVIHKFNNRYNCFPTKPILLVNWKENDSKQTSNTVDISNHPNLK